MSKETNKVVGSNIKRLRKLNGQKQSDIAERLKVSTQQISQYEKGEVNISADTLQRLAFVFGVSHGTFFIGVEK